MKKANCITLKKLWILFAVAMCASLSYAGDIQKETCRDLFMFGRILTSAANMPPKKGFSYEIGKAIDQTSDYFFKYFSVSDYSLDNSKVLFPLKTKIRSFKCDPQSLEFNLCLDIGYHRTDNLNIDAIRLESFFHHTFVSTIYHYDNKEIELSLSNALINNLLLDGMKLEIQANPYSSSGAVILTMAL